MQYNILAVALCGVLLYTEAWEDPDNLTQKLILKLLWPFYWGKRSYKTLKHIFSELSPDSLIGINYIFKMAVPNFFKIVFKETLHLFL